MNEQLQDALANLLSKTISGIDAGVAFMQAELPDVIMQLLTWKLSISAIAALFSLAVGVMSLKVIVKCFKDYLKEESAGVSGWA